MAKGDEYLDCHNETLEWTAKPWSVSLGAFLRQNGGFWTHRMDSSSRLSHLQRPWRLIHRLLRISSWCVLLCASRVRVILTESARECWCPPFGRLEEVCKFFLWWWRFVALVTADADYITAVREMGSMTQPGRPWIWQVRLRSILSTLWSVHIGQVARGEDG